MAVGRSPASYNFHCFDLGAWPILMKPPRCFLIKISLSGSSFGLSAARCGSIRLFSVCQQQESARGTGKELRKEWASDACEAAANFFPIFCPFFSDSRITGDGSFISLCPLTIGLMSNAEEDVLSCQSLFSARHRARRAPRSLARFPLFQPGNSSWESSGKKQMQRPQMQRRKKHYCSLLLCRCCDATHCERGARAFSFSISILFSLFRSTFLSLQPLVQSATKSGLNNLFVVTDKKF